VQSASLEWVPVVVDLFLEGASVERIVAWLDGTAARGDGYVAVRSMRAIDGFDAMIALRDTRPRALSVWYRAIERPTLAAAEALFGRATFEPRRLFELVFEDATRDLDDGLQLLVSCSASGTGLPSNERTLAGIALTVE
jgi:hypothetical protein